LTRPTSTKIDPDAIRHLTKSQQSELLDLLDCYSECFAVVLKYPNVVIYSSKPTLKEGFRPKLLTAYRVLERNPMMFVYVALLVMVLGTIVYVYSDHNPLSFLTESVPKSAKLMRWALALQKFSIVFQYYPGRKNVVADCLSRLQD